ncbi:hypothetical protein FGO68_gene12829 [Halteria grandinella]|uniref:Ubiquinol-cytochrome C reductase hinge domain-containing protein n=1 Tax=Halteria grandinella TaxID=5974 RepID=A0A8J8NVQ8_HALGN|nr:hypothetical protein FGO68_gene12829 [Halteria grandinella]
MGGGVAGWLTPGWTQPEPRLAPHIATPGYVKQMLKEGENPKDLLIEDCKPQCKFWKEKLERCEAKLEHIIKINPTKTCMYPMRDYVTCVEACVQPLIHNNLEGTH